MATVTVSTKGQIVLPKALRKAHRLTPGTQLEILELGGRIVIIPVPEDPVGAARGMIRFKRPVAEILRGLRKEESNVETRRRGSSRKGKN